MALLEWRFIYYSRTVVSPLGVFINPHRKSNLRSFWFVLNLMSQRYIILALFFLILQSSNFAIFFSSLNNTSLCCSLSTYLVTYDTLVSAVKSIPFVWCHYSTSYEGFLHQYLIIYSWSKILLLVSWSFIFFLHLV